ncbi:hypothetical protein EMCG_04063 [[Emmonsia] crescens]|uniref:Uncharacterized protein n=1 Tax=[Emmonsia] crescens TaxID=73230 RepID=A0A0G2IZD1_9EURO|nr:hypothetical protein EMCG_04063 [Emmonsia crescens UAMH 3008]
MELLFVANTLGRRRRYMSRSESEGHDLHDQGGQERQAFQGQGSHLQGHEHSGQGSHFEQAKMKMEPRYQMSNAQRAQVGLALNHPNHTIPQQAAPASTSSSVPSKKGNNESSQAGNVTAATDCHQSDQSTDVAARESDAAWSK